MIEDVGVGQRPKPLPSLKNIGYNKKFAPRLRSDIEREDCFQGQFMSW